MSMTKYSDLMPYLVPELPGVQPGVLANAIRTGAREFCALTGAWWKDLTAINVVAAQRDYDLAAGLPTDSEILSIRWLKVDDAVQDPSRFYLLEAATLRFVDDYIPAKASTGGLKVSVSLRPNMDDDALPGWIMDRWHEALVAFILVPLLADTGKPYGKTGRLAFLIEERRKWENRAKRAAIIGHVNQDLRAGNNDWLI
jgi:hypothetical protein